MKMFQALKIKKNIKVQSFMIWFEEFSDSAIHTLYECKIRKLRETDDQVKYETSKDLYRMQTFINSSN